MRVLRYLRCGAHQRQVKQTSCPRPPAPAGLVLGTQSRSCLEAPPPVCSLVQSPQGTCLGPHLLPAPVFLGSLHSINICWVASLRDLTGEIRGDKRLEQKACDSGNPRGWVDGGGFLTFSWARRHDAAASPPCEVDPAMSPILCCPQSLGIRDKDPNLRSFGIKKGTTSGSHKQMSVLEPPRFLQRGGRVVSSPVSGAQTPTSTWRRPCSPAALSSRLP